MSTLLTILLIVAMTAGAAYGARRLTGFADKPLQNFADTAPQIDIRQHLSGPIACDGVIFGPTGAVSARFTAEMEGVWDGASGRLKENFAYAGGGSQMREWRLELGNDQRFTATADDVIGTAEGEQRGAAVRMKYRLRLPEASGGHVLDVTDWMYLQENGNIINRSEMRKFGFKVAELVATMRPVAA